VLVLDDARHVELTAAELVANRVRARARLRMLLPTGHTPRGITPPCAPTRATARCPRLM
jgi:hypothetical protein